MDFSRWRTRFDEAKALFPETQKLSLAERLKVEVDRLTSMAMAHQKVTQELDRLGKEYLWLLEDQPYYNIHPNIVPYLCRCKLESIPAEYVEVPGGFDTVLIRFAAPDPDLTVEGVEYVRSILLAKPVIGRLDSDEVATFFETGSRPAKLGEPSSVLHLHIDLGERGDFEGVPTMKDWVITIPLDPEKTLEEEFARLDDIAPERIAPGTRRREVLKNCLRLIATVGFLANTPDDQLIQYDVLVRDRAKFAEASEERKKEFIEKARRRGKRGWNIGTNEMLVGPLPTFSESGSTGEGKELTHAHIRTGHLHAVRHGEGKRMVKIQWFRPTVVRPDLGFHQKDKPFPGSEG
jgi:hypothetical protein